MDFTASELELIKTLQKLNFIRTRKHEPSVEREMTDHIKDLSTQLNLSDSRWDDILQVAYQ